MGLGADRCTVESLQRGVAHMKNRYHPDRVYTALTTPQRLLTRRGGGGRLVGWGVGGVSGMQVVPRVGEQLTH